MNLSPSDPFIFSALIAFLGMGAGFIAGLFGIGGGILITPALVVLFKLCGILPDTAIHAAVGISMLTVVPTSIASLRTHATYDAIEKPTVKLWGPTVVMGSILGTFSTLYLSATSISFIFGSFVAVMAAFLGLVPAHVHALKATPGHLAQRVLAFLIGFFSALIGIGGGSLSVPTLVLCRAPIHRAIGTASVIGLLISLPAALIFLATQIYSVTNGAPQPGSQMMMLELIACGVLALTTMLTAPPGARLAHRLKGTKLRRIFAVLLAVIAVKMLLQGLT